MKQVKVKLEKNKAVIINKDTVYLEPSEDVQFIVINDIGKKDKLFYSLELGSTQSIKDRCFVVNSDNLKDDIKITLKSENSTFPDFFVLDLKVKNIKIIGDLLDEKYPDIIQYLFKEIKDLKRVNVLLNDKLERLEKKGAIE
ncbi:hypothetical protein KHQ81_12815 [Mycoplasmatota bacterium]|nr:hypothetical protein KHQ81_12815 [Mycoplasmatota bacterium]